MKQTSLVWLAVIALVLFLSAGLAQTALAQWSNDPSISASICTTTSMKSGLTAVSDGAAGIIASWVEYPSNKILGQRLGPDGRKLWLAEGILVIQMGSGPLVQHRMVSDQSGGIVIAGIYDVGPNHMNIRLQRMSNLGVPLWGTVGWSGKEAEIVRDGSGGVIIVWADWRGNWNLFVQRVDAGGNPQWNSTGVQLCPVAVVTGSNATTKIVADGSGGAVIVWTDTRSGNPDLYAQRISAAGVLQWPAGGVPIAVAPGDQSEPILTPDGTGGAYITWNDNRVSDKNIYAQRINGAGIVQWSANGINVSSATGATYINRRSIISDGSGGAIVAWSQWKACGGMVGCAQRLSGSGTLLWPVGGIDLTGCEAYAGEVINDGVGGFVV